MNGQGGWIFVACGSVYGGNRWEAVPRSCTVEEVVSYELQGEKRKTEWIEKIRDIDNQKTLKDGLKCKAGINDIAIDAYGNMHLCSLLRTDEIDIRNTDFDLGLERIREIRNEMDNIVNKSICSDCNLQGICNWCPGYSKMEYGNWDQPLDFFCEQKKRFIENVQTL